MASSPRAAAAAALAVLAVGLGTSACGGGSSGPSTTELRAEQAWHDGFLRLSARMIGALNAISVLFSQPQTVNRLQSGDARVAARLRGHETTLRGCTRELRALGPAPERFAEGRRAALRACKSLEGGARLLVSGIEQWRRGLGIDGINAATERLGKGQDDLARARADLAEPAA